MKPIFFVVACLFAVPCAHAESVWVQVRQSQLRAQPKFYAQSVVSVKYGDQLEKVSEDMGWVHVKAFGREGYLPLASVSQDHIVLNPADLAKVRADSAEVVMAGKGFSREVEQQYRREDSGLRYDLVDYVEGSSRISSAQVVQFMKSGGLVR